MTDDSSTASLRQIMYSHADSFLATVISNRKAWRAGSSDSSLRNNTSGFPLLWPENPGYNEYKALEERLESFIRESLVNPIIMSLLDTSGYEVLCPKRDRHYVFFSNERIEQVFFCEFIVGSGGERVGYRYSLPSPFDFDIPECISDLELERMEIIDWSCADDKQPEPVPTVDSLKEHYERVFAISSKYFFSKYFPKSVYDAFVEVTTDAVARANNLLGFQTIPRLSQAQLGNYRTKVLDELRGYRRKQKVYQQARRARRRNNRIPEADIAKLDEVFFDGGLYRALCGMEDFAVSFITSEYMYSIFGKDDAFDYTPVVNGYVKSIEQLEHRLMKLTYRMEGSDELWIKKNANDPERSRDDSGRPMKKSRHPYQQDKKWSPHVRFLPENEGCFDTALVPLANLLHDNMNCWRISNKARHFLLYKIREFASFDRNGYIHKDNLSDWGEVTRIRSNTWLILYMLLGGYDLDKANLGEEGSFETASVRYDELYDALCDIPRSFHRYLLYFDEGEPLKALRLYQREIELEAKDEKNARRLLFTKVDDFDKRGDWDAIETACERQILELSKECMPTRVDLVVRKEDIRTIWT